jgi:predicted RNA-binding Zn-ribbon protein involved in translation (DUF1610 family)
MEQIFICERCGAETPLSRRKEVSWERDRQRVTQFLCPACLDQVMNAAAEVRGIVGTEKAAAVHINPPPV